MKSVGVLVILIVVSFGYAQAPTIMWSKTYGGSQDDYGYSIQQTGDGGYIIVGTTHSFGAGGCDMWLLRTDSLGDTLWTKTYGWSGGDGAVSIQPTIWGGYIAVGSTDHTDTVSVWLIRLDDAGDTLWTRSIPPGYGAWWGNDVKQTADSGYVIAGTGQDRPDPFAFLLKTDSLGNVLWSNPGSGSYSNSVQQTYDGGFITTGAGGGGISLSTEFCLYKTDSIGNGEWMFTQDYPDFSCGYSVLETVDSGFIACGDRQGNVFILRADANGDTLWTKQYAGGIGLSVVGDIAGGYVIAGGAGGDALFCKIDAQGDTLLTTTYGGSAGDCFHSILRTSDDEYVAVGVTQSYGAGNNDLWLVKLGPSVGTEENKDIVVQNGNCLTTIFRGPLQLPAGKKCRVFDIAGRVVEPSNIKPGIYFVEIDDKIVQKVIKIR